MLIAFNGPFQYNKLIESVSTELYALAHECLKQPDLVQYYRHTDREFILDNGADELGVGMSGEQLRYLIAAMEPQLVILPDVLSKAPQTITRSEQFLAEAEWMPYQPKWMAVTQGRSLEEFVECFRHWLYHPDVTVIGVPYDIEFPMTPIGELDQEPKLQTKGFLRAFRRLAFLRGHVTMYAKEMEQRGKSIHLLGSNDLYELYQLRRDEELQRNLKNVLRSHDTTAPFSAAQSEIIFKMTDDMISFGREKDWPALNFHKDVDQSCLEWNLIAYWQAMSPDTRDWPQKVRDFASQGGPIE